MVLYTHTHNTQHTQHTHTHLRSLNCCVSVGLSFRSLSLARRAGSARACHVGSEISVRCGPTGPCLSLPPPIMGVHVITLPVQCICAGQLLTLAHFPRFASSDALRAVRELCGMYRSRGVSLLAVSLSGLSKRSQCFHVGSGFCFRDSSESVKCCSGAGESC
jgi:hypothetical protein